MDWTRTGPKLPAQKPRTFLITWKRGPLCGAPTQNSFRSLAIQAGFLSKTPFTG